MAALFQAHPELAIFVAIVLGFLVGRVHVRGVGLGTVVGTLLAGLAIGILSKPAVPDLLKWAFFDLLLFAIGYATGPQFFAGLKKEAIPQIYIAFIVSVTGLAAALGVAWAFSFDAGIAAGVTSGSLTQSAALGTALVTIADLPIAADLKQTLSAHVPIADAVTYVTGDVGVIVFLLAAAPMLLRANLREEAVKLEDAMSGNAPNAALRSAVQRFGFRAYRVDRPDFAGDGRRRSPRHPHRARRRARDRRAAAGTPRDTSALATILPATVIERGDVAHIVGSTANIERAVRAAGFVDPDPGRVALPFLAAAGPHAVEVRHDRGTAFFFTVAICSSGTIRCTSALFWSSQWESGCSRGRSASACMRRARSSPRRGCRTWRGRTSATCSSSSPRSCFSSPGRRSRSGFRAVTASRRPIPTRNPVAAAPSRPPHNRDCGPSSPRDM